MLKRIFSRDLLRLPNTGVKLMSTQSQRAESPAELKSKVEHYKILCISPNATLTEIREAYFRQVKKCHPDIDPSPEAREKFRLVQTAYKVLGNVDRRIGYDRTMNRDESSRGVVEVEPETLEELDDRLAKKKVDQEVFLKAKKEFLSTRSEWSFFHEKRRGAKNLKLPPFISRLTPEQREAALKESKLGKFVEWYTQHLRKLDVGNHDIELSSSVKHALKYLAVFTGFTYVLWLNTH